MLELRIEEGVMIVEPQKDNLLESLVSGITKQNLHHEVATDEALCHEEW